MGQGLWIFPPFLYQTVASEMEKPKTTLELKCFRFLEWNSKISGRPIFCFWFSKPKSQAPFLFLLSSNKSHNNSFSSLAVYSVVDRGERCFLGSCVARSCLSCTMAVATPAPIPAAWWHHVAANLVLRRRHLFEGFLQCSTIEGCLCYVATYIYVCVHMCVHPHARVWETRVLCCVSARVSTCVRCARMRVCAWECVEVACVVCV